MRIRRFFVNEHLLQGSGPVRQMPAIRPVTEDVQEFLDSGVEVLWIRASASEQGDYPGVMIAYGYAPGAGGAKYRSGIFFERRSAIRGFADVDGKLHAFLDECSDPEPKIDTVVVGTCIQKLTVVTVVLCRVLA